MGLLLAAVFFTVAVAATTAAAHLAPTSSTMPPNAANIAYQLPGRQTVPRTVAAALAERISVLDFGAKPFSKEDQTAAFQAALDSRGDWPVEVFVPEGEFALNGCVSIGSRRTLHLGSGAVLTRSNCSAGVANQCAPITVSGAEAALTGDRGSEIHVSCTGGGADFGVVRLGPASLVTYLNVEWNRVSGLRLIGPGAASGDSRSIGVLVDSSEPFVGGSCYQNTIADLVIADVAVGLRAVKYVNANRFANLQMLSIGQYGVHFVNNTENALSGLFVSHSFNLTAVIKGEGSGFNSFANVQSEPGGGRLLDFDDKSFENRVDGHDNCPHGSVVLDPAFTWIAGGRVMIGNFSAAPLGYRRQLTVEGTAFVRALEHGLPRVARGGGGGGASALTVTEGAPVVMAAGDVIPTGGVMRWALCGLVAAADVQDQVTAGKGKRGPAGYIDLSFTATTAALDALADVRVVLRRSPTGLPAVLRRACTTSVPDAACPIVVSASSNSEVDGCVDVALAGPAGAAADVIVDVRAVGRLSLGQLTIIATQG